MCRSTFCVAHTHTFVVYSFFDAADLRESVSILISDSSAFLLFSAVASPSACCLFGFGGVLPGKLSRSESLVLGSKVASYDVACFFQFVDDRFVLHYW